MPADKRSKEQTWKEDELKQSLKHINQEKSHSKSKSKHGDDSRPKDSSHRSKVEGSNRKDKDEQRERRHRDDKDREKHHRDDRDERRHRDDRDRRRADDHERDKRRDRGGDEKERRHHGSSDRKTSDRERGHRDDGGKERRHREDGDRERKHREDGDRERKHREDGDRERKHRDDRDREKRRRDEVDKERRHRDDGDRERRHKDDRDRERRHRDEGDKERKHRDDKDREKRHRDDGDKDRRHRDDGDRDKEKRHSERRHQSGEERDRRHRDRDNDDRERRDREEKDGRHHENGDRKYRDSDDKERKHRDRKERDENDSRHRDRDKQDENQSDRRDRRDRERRDKHEESRDHRKREHRDDKYKSADERDKRQDDNEMNHHNDRRHRDRPGKTDYDDTEESNGADNHNRKVSGNAKENAKTTALSKEQEQEVDEYGGYDEDDFEDYDDDFEDDDGGADEGEGRAKSRAVKSREKKATNNEMEELFDALNAENERLLASSRKSFNSDDTTDYEERRSGQTTANKPRSFINFVAAKQRDMNQKAASKARKRCTELLSIVELDTVHMTLFDLPPVREYDLYMSSFGRTNAQQVYIQTNDDNLDRDVQTEDIEVSSRWTQHPAEGATVCGVVDDTHPGADANAAVTKADDGRLTAFLQRACQVVERLINEEHVKSSYTEKSASFSSSEGYVSLRSVEIFSSRQVARCHFSPSDSAMLLTMHTAPTKPVDKKLDKYGMIGVWNTNDPSQPQKIVASASMPTCCCFSPIKTTLVFGGMQDGSLVAWDLREPPTMHHSYICGGQDWLLRFPTYNTAGVLQYDNHNSPITALVPVLTDSGKSASQEAGSGLSFQLATLERNGIVNLWVVAEILETNMAGSESDLGLSPNGKIKLLKSSTISLTAINKIDINQSLYTLDLKLNPTNHNHFYVATDSGVVLHGTRFGTQKIIPRCYKSVDTTPCVITSVDLHPFGHPVLLAGCEDGSIRLHHLSAESPIIIWETSTNGSAIRKVLWSRSCAYIIFVLDSNSIVHMWDLLRNDAEPMASEQVSEANSSAVDICLSDESQSHSRPKMVVNYDDGKVQVHLLSSHVSNLQPGENEQFSRFVEQL